MSLEILRSKDVLDYEAAALLQDAEEYGPAARWYGRGCAAAGFTPGGVVYAYYLKQVAGYVSTQDVTCPGEDPAAVAAAVEADEIAPAPDMGDEWVIATFPPRRLEVPAVAFPARAQPDRDGHIARDPQGKARLRARHGADLIAPGPSQVSGPGYASVR